MRQTRFTLQSSQDICFLSSPRLDARVHGPTRVPEVTRGSTVPRGYQKWHEGLWTEVTRVKLGVNRRDLRPPRPLRVSSLLQTSGSTQGGRAWGPVRPSRRPARPLPPTSPGSWQDRGRRSPTGVCRRYVSFLSGNSRSGCQVGTACTFQSREDECPLVLIGGPSVSLPLRRSHRTDSCRVLSPFPFYWCGSVRKTGHEKPDCSLTRHHIPTFPKGTPKNHRGTFRRGSEVFVGRGTGVGGLF